MSTDFCIFCKNLIPSRSALPCSALRVSLETEGNGQSHPFAPWPEYKKGGDEFNIPFSRQQFAEYLGVERSGLSMELGKMRVEGLLDFHKNHFLLKMPDADRPFPSVR